MFNVKTCQSPMNLQNPILIPFNHSLATSQSDKTHEQEIWHSGSFEFSKHSKQEIFLFTKLYFKIPSFPGQSVKAH